MVVKKSIRQNRDPVARRKVILQAAKTLFSQKGYSGASVGNIAKLAQVNKSLIYHYFKDKNDLWHQVKVYFSIDANEDLIEDIFKLNNLKDFINRFINFRYQILSKDEQLRRMLYWQRLEVESLHSAQDSSELRQIEESDFKVNWLLGEDKWNELYDRFQQDGQMNKKVSLHNFALFMCYSLEGMFDKSAPVQNTSESQRLDYLDFVIDSCCLSLKA